MYLGNIIEQKGNREIMKREVYYEKALECYEKAGKEGKNIENLIRILRLLGRNK